jgi:hypothetical protein
MPDSPPTSVSTATDKLSSRPVKKRALNTPTTLQAASVSALFANPDKPIVLPTGPGAKTLAPPPEIVTNVQGSSSGAGSGEFHVYKASRRREYERIRMMDEEDEKEKQEAEWEKKREQLGKKDEGKTNKNKAKREKAKMRKEKAKSGGKVVDGTEKKGLVKMTTVGKAEEGDTYINGEVKAVDESITPGIMIHDDDGF